MCLCIVTSSLFIPNIHIDVCMYIYMYLYIYIYIYIYIHISARRLHDVERSGAGLLQIQESAERKRSDGLGQVSPISRHSLVSLFALRR